MAIITSHYTDESVRETSLASSPVYQAFMILLVGFTAAPLIAGVDKFFDLLTDWTRYLAPVFPDLVHLTPMTFMKIVGVIEIIAAFLVAWKPSIGGYVVAAWLIGIIINLLLLHSFYDIVLRDLGLAIGAVALARLGEHFAR